MAQWLQGHQVVLLCSVLVQNESIMSGKVQTLLEFNQADELQLSVELILKVRAKI